MIGSWVVILSGCVAVWLCGCVAVAVWRRGGVALWRLCVDEMEDTSDESNSVSLTKPGSPSSRTKTPVQPIPEKNPPNVNQAADQPSKPSSKRGSKDSNVLVPGSASASASASASPSKEGRTIGQLPAGNYPPSTHLLVHRRPFISLSFSLSLSVLFLPCSLPPFPSPPPSLSRCLSVL